MAISVGVVAHRFRLMMAEKLANYTAAEAISIDDGDLGCKANHLRLLRWLLTSPAPWAPPTPDSWIVVLEDDAIPVKDFRLELAHALAVAPSPVVSLYLGRSRPEHWQEPIARVMASDVSWLTAPALLHGVGYAVQRRLVPSLLDEVPGMTFKHRPKFSRHSRDVDLPIDQSISKWAEIHGHTVSYARPSLVNHDRGIPMIPDDADERLAQTRYLDESSGLPSGEDRVAWMFGSRAQLCGKTWDSSSREITPPMILSA